MPEESLSDLLSPGDGGGEVKQKTVLKDGEVLLIDARSTCRPPA